MRRTTAWAAALGMAASAAAAQGVPVPVTAAASTETGAAEETPTRADALAGLVARLDRGTEWVERSAIPIGFLTHHPQGMTRVGDALFVSSVEIVERTERYDAPRDGYDRSAGKGVGHLFKIDLEGHLLGSITLGEGDVYHPGGIDFDGEAIWVPVAEYRPDSRSIVYKVDPDTLEATEAFRFDDHLGGIVHDVEAGALHAVSWGSRRLYRFKLDEDGAVARPEEAATALNPQHYVDYQDCEMAGTGRAVCTGLVNYDVGGTTFALGGVEFVDLEAGRPVHQVPIQLWTGSGLAMTHNPVWLEALEGGGGLRGYFMPEDDQSRLYVYEAMLPAE